MKDGIYSVPTTIEAHLDFVSPTMRFPIRKMLKDENIEILDLPDDYDFINADDPDCNETLQDVNCSDLTSEYVPISYFIHNFCLCSLTLCFACFTNHIATDSIFHRDCTRCTE